MSDKQRGFEYKELDPEGFETLSIIADAKNFNKWTFDAISPWCYGKILEFGSGIGNISSQFVEQNYDITVSDIRSNYRVFLSQKFPGLSADNKVLPFDLVLENFDHEYRSWFNTFDSVFALNVVEHIENDSFAIANAAKFLKPGGTLIILVPAFQSLYNNFDKELYHYRRYNNKDLEQLFTKNNLTPERSFYFNAGGIPGWFVSGNIQKNKTIPANQMKFYDKLVPLFRMLDKMLLHKVGLSVICIGKKK